MLLNGLPVFGRKSRTSPPRRRRGVDDGHGSSAVEVLDAYVERLLQASRRNIPVGWDAEMAEDRARKADRQAARRASRDPTEVDGSFPNHPDPRSRRISPTSALVAEKLDFGIAFDGDADRIGASTPRVVCLGDQWLMILAEPGAEGTAGHEHRRVKASQILFEISQAWWPALMWKTGHSLIKSR